MSLPSQAKKCDPIRSWFRVLEEMDEFIGIRFGHQGSPNSPPEWTFLGHDEFDGIGAFAHLLRQRGASVKELPSANHSTPNKLASYLKIIHYSLKNRKFTRIRDLTSQTDVSRRTHPPANFDYHAFTEEETSQIKKASQRHRISVNSFLLYSLDRIIRADLSPASSTISWMVPVNLRGHITQLSDEENHSSYVTVSVQDEDSMQSLHHSIYRQLNLGQHWVAWNSYKLGNFLSSGMKKALIRSNRAILAPCLGSFSNLGKWNLDPAPDASPFSGIWFFCPPVLRCQPLGAGCVTYGNRLTLTLQTHPAISVDPAISQNWMRHWTKDIKSNLEKI